MFSRLLEKALRCGRGSITQQKPQSVRCARERSEPRTRDGASERETTRQLRVCVPLVLREELHAYMFHRSFSTLLALLSWPQRMLCQPAPNCGFSVDCPRQYTSAAVNISAALWDPTDKQAASSLAARHTQASGACRSAKVSAGAASQRLGLDSGLQVTGGWCLDTKRSPADAFSSVNLPNGQSYFLPKPHVAADVGIVAFLHDLLSPRFLSVSDFGAGVGQYGRALLSKNSHHRWMGYDAAGNIEEATGGFVKYFDLSMPLSLPRTDWVMSFEVGEHVPPAQEMMVVRNLHAHNCRGIILSWAYLRKAGVGHVNNHGRPYLVQLFSELGYRVNEELSSALRANRTKAHFARGIQTLADRGNRSPRKRLDGSVGRGVMKALRYRNVSQRWFWLRATVFERITPLRTASCTR